MGRRWWGDGESRQDPWEGVGERHPGAGGGGGAQHLHGHPTATGDGMEVPRGDVSAGGQRDGVRPWGMLRGAGRSIPPGLSPLPAQQRGWGLAGW